MTVCVTANCGGKHYAKGYCMACYKQVRRGAVPTVKWRKERGCNHPDCIEPHYAKGYCHKHFQRKRKKGNTRDWQPKECRVRGCPEPVKARDLCSTHLARWYTHGDLRLRNKVDPTKRFWKYVLKEERGEPLPGECWEWTGWCSPQGGYDCGRFWYQGKGVLAHRHSWELTNGPIPKGMWVMHTCKNYRCVNPEHLFLGTRQDSTERAFNDGRRRRSNGQGKAC